MSFILIGVAAYGRLSAVVTSLTLVGSLIACGVFLFFIALTGLIGALKHHQVLLFFVSFRLTPGYLMLRCRYTNMYVYVCVCVYIYIYIYQRCQLVRFTRKRYGFLRFAPAYRRTMQSLRIFMIFADSNLQSFRALYSNCCQFAMTPPSMLHEAKHATAPYNREHEHK